MPRSHWDALQVDTTQEVAIDIESTPLSRVASDSSLIAAVAHLSSTGGGHVSIYRDDPKDAPTPVNVDHYTVFTDLASDPRLEEFAIAASTSLNPNLVQDLQDHVFWVKEDPGDDHWLPVVPSSVMALIKIDPTGSD